jgi:hypothetical protein
VYLPQGRTRRFRKPFYTMPRGRTKNYKKMDRVMHKAAAQVARKIAQAGLSTANKHKVKGYRPGCLKDRIGAYASSPFPIGEQLGGGAIADSILDRIIHGSYKLEIKGDVSMRQRIAEAEKTGEMDLL